MDLSSHLIKFLQRLLKAAPLLFVSVFVAHFVLCETVVQNEAWIRIPFYGQSRHRGWKGEVSKIYLTCVSEGMDSTISNYHGPLAPGQNVCLSRGRPLSYLVELADVKLLKAINSVFSYGPKVTFHLIAVLLSILMAGLAFQRLFPYLNPRTSWLLASFMGLSSPVLMLNMEYQRNAKVLSMFTASSLLLFWAWARELTWAEVCRSRTKLFGVISFFLYFCLFSLSDEQAAFFIGMFFVVGFLDLFKDRNRSVVPVTLFLTVCFYGAFCLWIDPWLGLRLENVILVQSSHDPKTWSPDQNLFSNILKTIGYGFQSVYGDFADHPTISILMRIFYLAISALFVVSWVRGRPAPSQTNRPIPYWFVPVVFVLWASALGMMIANQSAISNDDLLRQGYYFLPFVPFLLCGTLVVLHQTGFLKRQVGTAAEVRILILLVAFAISNLGSLQTAKSYRWAHTPGLDELPLERLYSQIHEVDEKRFEKWNPQLWHSKIWREHYWPRLKNFMDYYLDQIGDRF